MTKKEHFQNLLNNQGTIAALAIDQRGALRKMMEKYQDTPATIDQVKQFKSIISEQLTPYASAILLDAEYGIDASKERHASCGLLTAYEKTGYDASQPGRLPDILDVWSVRRLREAGSDSCKFLLYYDVDESDEINDHKKAFIERIGSECIAEELPFFLEVVTYDAEISDAGSAEFAKVKPHKVNDMMKVFSDPRYAIDCLKVEVPVNMKYVAGYAEGEVVYSKDEAQEAFKSQAESTKLPFIFLSAGVSSELFNETLDFAKEAGSTFNGVLCGRATWAGAVEVFIKEGEAAAKSWCQNVGRKNIETLNNTLSKTATPVIL
ncbi:MAG: tagatose-bisphosphate aldolase [Streptococcaceae bacterium]|jgi:tagatose 1,6-diphosphate aldolase|nr:tagatose-bisphosphate aldolase [Streptococcaceae bacterium]